MNSTELIQRIQSVGIRPIRVTKDAGRPGLTVDGSLDDFLEAAKAIGAGVIFFHTNTLTIEKFLCELDDCDNENDDGEVEISGGDSEESESFDLTVAMPALAEFKRHIGSECEFFLTAKSLLATLDFHVAETWWKTFVEERRTAVQKVTENREAIRAKMEEKEEEEEAALLKQVYGLLNDSEFCRIPTQRGMKVYALEKFPELEAVNDYRLLAEVAKLSDKVKARKRR